MRLSVALSLVTLLVGLTFCATQRDSLAAESEVQKGEPILTIAYKVADLPVWTAEKEYDPSVLMRLIQASVSPSEWEADRGDSRLAPYAKNNSLVISTRRENHDKITDLLESMRPKK